MNKKQLFIKLLAIVVGGIAVFLLSSCFTSLRILSCKKSCVESCNSCSSSEDNISGHEYGVYYTLDNSGEFYWVSEVGYKETDVKIPETYEGYPVMGLKYRTFEHYQSYGGCGGGDYLSMHLSSLTLPKSIRFIEIGVFASGSDYNYHTESATCDKLIFEGTIQDWCEIEFGSFPLYGGTKLYIDGELLTNLVIPESVTEIKEKSFAFYSWFESVTLHENITKIGEYAFWNSNIKTITFPCKDLVILQDAFFRCGQLEEVTFTGENLTLANGSIFAECSALKEVEWNTVNITEIPAYAFADCVGLESFVIPASVETIMDYAFEGCYNLVEIYNLPNLGIYPGSIYCGGVARYAIVVHAAEGDNSYVLTDGDYKFLISDEGATLYRYTGLGGSLNLHAPQGVESFTIGARAFCGDHSITAVNIPDCVTEIGDSAFYSCDNLEWVSGCAGLKIVGNHAFQQCSNLESINLSSIEEIGFEAFCGCHALTSVKLPETVKKIGSLTFAWCTMLQSVSLGNVEEIEIDAFTNCIALKSLDFPKSLTKIKSGFFKDCPAEVTYAGTLEEWAMVTLDKDACTEVTIICTDGEWTGKI